MIDQPIENTASARLEEPVWQLLSNPQHFARTLHKLREEQLNLVLRSLQDHSLVLAAGCLEYLNGNTPSKREQAALQMLHLTSISRDFVDAAVAFGMADESLQSDPERVASYCGDLAELFKLQPCANATLGPIRPISHLSDQQAQHEALSIIGSFAETRQQLMSLADYFRDGHSSLEQRLFATKTLFLLIQAEEVLRGAIRSEDLSRWIDIYDPTQIDCEIIVSWLQHCDPTMRVGYHRLLRQAALDPSERGQRAQSLLKVFPDYNKEPDVTSQASVSSNTATSILHELRQMGVTVSVQTEVLSNICARAQLASSTTAEPLSFLEHERAARRVRQRVAKDLLQSSGAKIRFAVDPCATALSVEETSLSVQLAIRSVAARSTDENDAILTRKNLALAIAIADPVKRSQALNFLDKPTNANLECLKTSAAGSPQAKFVTTLLTSPFREIAFNWLNEIPIEAWQFARDLFLKIGVHNELPAVACLSIISQQRRVDVELCELLLACYQITKNELLKVHLMHALALCQAEDSSEVRLKFFKARQADAHVLRGATIGLALLGANGRAELQQELIRSNTEWTAVKYKFWKIEYDRFFRRNSECNINTDAHGRRSAKLTSRQQEIVDALAQAGPSGALVVRDFLKSFDQCDVTHTVARFLRYAQQPWFGLSPDQIIAQFDQFCAGSDSIK